MDKVSANDAIDGLAVCAASSRNAGVVQPICED